MRSLAFPVASALCSGFAFQFFTELSPDRVSEALLNPHHFAQASGSFCHELQEVSGHLWPNTAWTHPLLCTLLRLFTSLGRGGVPRLTVGGVIGPWARKVSRDSVSVGLFLGLLGMLLPSTLLTGQRGAWWCHGDDLSEGHVACARPESSSRCVLAGAAEEEYFPQSGP